MFIVYGHKWLPVLTLGPNGNKYEGNKIDIGCNEFNKVFRDNTYHIIKRECSGCRTSHKQIYYKRLTQIKTFDVCTSMKQWRSVNNLINKDFAMYGTLQDALADKNRWKFCNYDDVPGVGGFRDCGPNGYVPCEWVGDILNKGYGGPCGKSAKFSILIKDRPKLQCPVGSKLIANQGGINDIGGCGLEGCENRYENKHKTIIDCKRACDEYHIKNKDKPKCRAFTWASKHGDRNHLDKTVCTLYSDKKPTQFSFF